MRFDQISTHIYINYVVYIPGNHKQSALIILIYPQNIQLCRSIPLLLLIVFVSVSVIVRLKMVMMTSTTIFTRNDMIGKLYLKMFKILVI